MINYNTDLKTCQEELKKNFTPKKNSSLLLAESFERLQSTVAVGSCLASDSYSINVRNCGNNLLFGKNIAGDFKLISANFCRVRLCPMCGWRRSLKIFSQVSRIMDVIQDDYIFLFLTLTVRNVDKDSISSKVDEMQNAFRESFVKSKLFKNSVQGYFRALEITHDTNRYITPLMFSKAKSYYKRRGLSVGDVNPNFNFYHPHFHVILAVPKTYFKKSYIKRDTWLKMWQNAMHDDTITQVDITVCKSKDIDEVNSIDLSSVVAEVAKYSVKSSDYIVEDDEPLTDSSVETMFYALKGRRLCGLGGVFKSTWQQVRKSDETDFGEGDLIDINGEIRDDVFVQLYKYDWSVGTGYKLTQIVDNF